MNRFSERGGLYADVSFCGCGERATVETENEMFCQPCYESWLEEEQIKQEQEKENEQQNEKEQNTPQP